MGAGSRRGTILYRNAELVRGLQFYFFACLEVVGAGVMLWGCSPYNSVRDYPGYNSKLGYNSIFSVFGIREGG